MQALLDGLEKRASGVLVLRGQAGICKTALLREVVQRAVGLEMQVAQGLGIQSEMEFDFAGLHQLLLPFAGGLEHLPGPQRTALQTVFGLATGQTPDRFMVGSATLTLLTDAAKKRSVLCVVDDAQWLDRVSLEVLIFVARRLLADRVGMVFGLRAEEEEPAGALSGFPELHVGPLPPEAQKELLEMAAGGRVPESMSRRVLAEAVGHPLALVELGSELAAGRGVPDAMPGQPLRLGERLELLYLDRVRELPSAARTLLVLPAAEQPAGRRPDPGAGFRHVDLDEPADWRSADRSGPSGQPSATSWSRRPARQRWVNSVELDPFQTKLRLLAPLATPRIKAAVAQNLGKLKLLLERPVQHKDFCRGNAIGTDKSNYIK